VVFAGADEPWPGADADVEVCRDFPSNERRLARLFADHLRVGPAAARRGAAALLTVGFSPLRPAGLPVAMQVVAVPFSPRDGGARSHYRQWALARGLERASLVIANSAWTAAQLGSARAEIIVSPEGLRHDRFTRDGERGLPGGPERYLLWASNLYGYKRVDLALAAYAALPPALRGQFPLLVAGGDWGDGRARAEAVAARLGIAGQVRFLGWVADADLPRLYRGAQAHLLSTTQETFGRCVLEAMACGCPSVLQDLPVLREVAGECALYVDYGDPAAAAAALASLCGPGETRSRLSAAGIARASHFSFERVARERVGAVLQLLEANGR
jgi:glycosyltransferase involved in cell wall biosynthesis